MMQKTWFEVRQSSGTHLPEGGSLTGRNEVPTVEPILIKTRALRIERPDSNGATGRCH
jgi:hypothetical protein